MKSYTLKNKNNKIHTHTFDDKLFQTKNINKNLFYEQIETF